MAKNGTIESAGLSKVGQEEKKSWGSIAFIWAGSVCCVPALMVGGGITMGLTFGQAALAMFTGYGICVLLMILLSIQSSDLGLPSVAAIAGAFGKKGSSYVISSIIAFCFICWFGFQAVVCGDAFAAIMQNMGVPLPSTVSTIIWGLVMCITAVVGINWIKILNIVSVPALIIILVYAMIVVFRTPGSAAQIANYQPATNASMIVSIGTAVGGFASGSVLAGDVTRYCKSRRDVVISSIIGVIPMGVGTMLAGGVLAIHSGALGMDTGSVVTMLSSVGSPILGLLVLVLATWTTNVSNAYSSGFALLNLTGAKDDKRPIFTLAAGIVGTLLAVLGITNYFNNFLNILSVGIPPVAGVVIMDYFVINKANPATWKPTEGVNLAGLLAWLAGSAVALAFPSFLIPSVNAIVIGCVLYLILYPLLCRNKRTA